MTMKDNGKRQNGPAAPARRKQARSEKDDFLMPVVHILDPDLAREYIRDRQRRGIDQYDEVWEGVYIVPPLANNTHQALVMDLSNLLYTVVRLEGRGMVYPGVNLSDRRAGWKKKFRAPDIVVVLNDSPAIDCDTHFMGGLDFLVEIQSPGDETEKKLPFYSELRVREALIIQRDTRQMRLLRHNGQELKAVKAADFAGGKWLLSAVVPLAFRRRPQQGGARTEVRRTDGMPGSWTV
jgi:Uma2 family endonuclease